MLSATIASLCSSCGDVSRNLNRILTSDLDLRTGNGKDEFVWSTDVSAVARSAAQGCTFCSFVECVFLKPYYDPQSLNTIPTRAPSRVEDLPEKKHEACLKGSGDSATSCLVCAAQISKKDDGLCYRCRPRVARYLALHAAEKSYKEIGRSVDVPISISIRKASWPPDGNTNVEGLTLKGYVESSSKHPLNTNGVLFRVHCLSDDPAAEIVHQRPRLCQFNDQYLFQEIRSLLKDCADGHKCGPEPVRTDNRPTRLVDLGRPGSDDPVRLGNGATSEPYVALSYCWGGRQALLTKKETLKEYHRAIPVSELSQSIQDAISLTRELGMRFLWVDCLCIVQDDKQDKSREIGRMRNVYANSFLTICAGRAIAAVDGFLNPQTEPFALDPDAIAADATDDRSSQAAKAQSRNPADVSGTLQLILPDGKTGHVNIRRRVEYSSAVEPLVARAWTYEERLLSKRIVNFGQSITWRCLDSHCLLGDTGDHWFPPDEENVNSVRGEPLSIALQPKRLLRRWHDLVSAYSTRSMYNEGDKLPAIAGIVQQIQPDNDPQAYVAGLWRSQLASDLMWCMPQHGTKTSTWRAPSWSWASLNGMVRFQDAADMVNGSTVLISDVTYDFQLKSDLSPFGELRSAFLHLTGRLGRADRGLIAWKTPHDNAPTALEEILCDPSDHSTISYEGTSRLKIDLAEDSLRRREDVDIKASVGDARLIKSEPVWCLPLHGTIDFAPDQSWDDDMLETRMDGLLLTKREDGSYSRIGIFEMTKYDDGRSFTWGEAERIHPV